MERRRYPLTVKTTFICIVLFSIGGCKKSSDDEVWVLTKDVIIQPYKSDPVDGKQYLDVIYENVGNETFRKIKYELIRRTGSTIDTSERIIIPETILQPKERHLIPPHIGRTPATFDEVKAGKVWVVKDSK